MNASVNGGDCDVAIQTIIGPELKAVLAALGISDSKRKADQGDLFWHGQVASTANRAPLSVVVHCQGEAGNGASSAAATKIIERFNPRLIILVGIAAGRRDKVKIGDVAVPRVVVDMTQKVATAEGLLNRPTIPRLPHVVTQLLRAFDPKRAGWHDRFRDLFGQPIKVPPGSAEDFEEYVAVVPEVHDVAISSDDLLLRNPNVLLAQAAGTHQQIYVGEMEAAGFAGACESRHPPTPWLVVRGISDFGDTFKNDDFHRLASAAAASYVASFVDHGVNVSIFAARATQTPLLPTPSALHSSVMKMLQRFPAPNAPSLVSRLERVTIELSELCSKAEVVSAAIDEALDSKSVAQYRQLRLKQAQVSASIQNAIIRYIDVYLDSAPRGDVSRRTIRFTDSRALFGASRLAEWVNDNLYLRSLSKYTERAASKHWGEGLVSRSFVVASFAELALDPALLMVLESILRRHLEARVSVSVVSLRYLEDMGMAAVNFCAFEDGLVMSLDLGLAAQLQVFHEAHARDGVREIHKELGSTQPGVVHMASIDALKIFCANSGRHREGSLAHQVALEKDGSSSLLERGNGPDDYDDMVAQWWSDPAWEQERRAVEESFLTGLLERFVGGQRKPEVIDVACGTGAHAFLLAELGYSVVACDASWHQVTRARLVSNRRDGGAPSLLANPFFRTLRWTELPSRYTGKFSAVLCLGGSLIHADKSDLPAVARSFCQIARRDGVIVVDHREASFFDIADNRRVSHPGHTREVDVNVATNEIVFRMRNNAGATSVIRGTLHPINDIIAAFEAGGARLLTRLHDYSLESQVSDAIVEWHHLIFQVR